MRMLRVLACVVTVSSLSGVAPAQPPVPQPPRGVRHPGEGVIDPTAPYAADLWDIAAGMYDCRVVRTRGILSTLDPRHLLGTERGGSVVVVPVPQLVADATQLVGRRVEMVGLVRERGNDRCRDENLPPAPGVDAQPGWPRMSITVWSVVDDTSLDVHHAQGSASRLGELLASSDPPSPQPVTVVGRFCGVNLCGGMTAPPPSAEAWVLQDGGAAVWVVGRPPRGKGWSLDLKNQGDTRHWVEVVGRVDRCGQAPCLRAKRVTMASPPRDAEAAR